MRGGNVVRMNETEKCGVARHAIDADATIAGRSAGPAGLGSASGQCGIEKSAVHANANERPDADATTAGAVVPANRTGTRMPAAGRLVSADAYACIPDSARAAPAASRTAIHRPALLIQPHSLFCILLVGELPTVFPTARSAKAECNGRFLRTPTG
ncbi:hypothetical protein [Burkholderia territorii]|uniref:hypothetical protein n=1 Tax=Burkholderia territorii TaxID=1503055 RepID=UPI0014787000|nr:hypothetical protein [Burkholderia territorii]